MKKMIALFVAVLFLNLAANAQRKALKGSGNVETKSFEYSKFSKINLQDLLGNVEIEVGKPYSIAVSIDDNLANLLSVFEKDGELIVKLIGNENNKLYIEATNIKVKINLPTLLSFKNYGNSDVTIRNIKTAVFKLDNYGNGNSILIGSANEINIVKTGNGNVDASKCIAKYAIVTAEGNDDVIINASESFTVQGKGNGDVKQIGVGVAANGSTINGNGSISIK
jgi:hypothetical protein